jgi:rhodanese-related sulfurtransferase
VKAGSLAGLMLLALLLAPWATAPATPAAVKFIAPATLKGMLGNPQVMVIDVRTPGTQAANARMIKGAVRRDPGQVPIWAQTLPRNKTLVLYCA